jgi:hypothetical protein
VANKKPDPDAPDPQLPGLEDPKNEKVITAAKKYHRLVRERMKAGDEEVKAHDALKEVMHKEGLPKYKYRNITVVLTTNEKAKVKIDEDGVE